MYDVQMLDGCYCADCGEAVYQDQIPTGSAGSAVITFIPGRIRCFTRGCLFQNGMVDHFGDPVNV